MWLARETLGWISTAPSPIEPLVQKVTQQLDLERDLFDTCTLITTLQLHLCYLGSFVLNNCTYATPSPQKKTASPSSMGMTSDMVSKPEILFQDL